LPEFDVGVLTTRSGTRTVRVVAENISEARGRVQSECDARRCHCPSEWCTDDVQSIVLDVRRVVLDDVTLICADGVGLGTLYADDTLGRKDQRRA